MSLTFDVPFHPAGYLLRNDVMVKQEGEEKQGETISLRPN